MNGVRRALGTLATGTALLLAGCGGTGAEGVGQEPSAVRRPESLALVCWPNAERPPCGPGAEVGTEYEHQLYTHCGIEYTQFDGRLWLAQPPLHDGYRNPPAGWGNPSQLGFVELVGVDNAVFRAGPLVAHFTPAPGGYRPPACD